MGGYRVDTWCKISSIHNTINPKDFTGFVKSAKTFSFIGFLLVSQHL